MMEATSILVPTKKEALGKVAWRCPSNIALVKYWGKIGHQIPANPSLSFTLNNAYTETEVAWIEKSSLSDSIEVEFYFDGRLQEKFKQKIINYFESISNELNFLRKYNWIINSSNSFPHSTGIASSASSMGALALCLCSIERELEGNQTTDEEFFQRASHFARLGSGSAARSIYGGSVLWGQADEVASSSDNYAVSVNNLVGREFDRFYDAILIVSKEEKAVSSRAGHALMNNHPYAETRYKHARQNIKELLDSMSSNNLDKFVQIIENEALALHSLMMISDPSVVLFKPNTWEILNRVRTFRQETGLPIGFTLDAGPNVHLLYPEGIKSEVEAFINQELVVYCTDNLWIADKVGAGPIALKYG